MTFSVADLNCKKPDAAGVMVEQIYIKVDALYAVYRTEERIVIQFADDQAQGADQRKSLSDLYVTRGVVDSLLDDIRHAGDANLVMRARRYERRLADALTLGLQGQSNQAAAELENLHRDLVDERKSSARQTYLLASLGVAAALVLAIAVLGSPLLNFGLSGEREATATSMWFAGAVGAVGAFFSTALAVRNREIEPSISLRDTVIDAALRMFVGAVSGTLLYTLIKAHAFGLTIGSTSIDGGDEFLSSRKDWLLVLLVAFAGGFFERLVPNMFAKVAAADAKEIKTPMSARSAAEDAASNERNPLGERAATVAAPAPAAPAATPQSDAAAVDPEHDEDDCCDRPGTPDLLTQDVELPEAVGGVENAPVAP